MLFLFEKQIEELTSTMPEVVLGKFDGGSNLWCTDAAKWALHLRSTRRHASYVATRASVLGLIFFFFFYGFLSTWLWFTPTWLWFALNRADSARIGLYRPNRSVLAGGQNWPKQPKQTKMAEIDLESCIALAKNWNLSLTVELKPTNLSLTWVETLNWIQRYSHIHQHHRNPQQHNYYSTLLAYNQVSCNIKRLWLPQNALCFLFYWTH